MTIKIECEESFIHTLMQGLRDHGEEVATKDRRINSLYDDAKDYEIQALKSANKLLQAEVESLKQTPAPIRAHTDFVAETRNLISLIEAGCNGGYNKIPAIKAVRALTGLGLRESLDMIQEFSPRVCGKVQTHPTVTKEQIQSLVANCFANDKIGGIKVIREITGLGLMESKDLLVAGETDSGPIKARKKADADRYNGYPSIQDPNPCVDSTLKNPPNKLPTSFGG